ncbi:uncharacterized protein LOC131310936 [Rhododendron vialii]|uniref:uncharacterized protein LOC131310936 n=1 Tax=Rhododendron vialii TaxID=182163 RepID=UPI00265DF314|nr:uncharacterized protein LOC131310936 [Rhododendron vialii]
MMGMQSLVTGLPLKGLGCSNGLENVNNSGNVWTSLHKSPLLLPLMPRTKDSRTLPSFVPLNVSLKSGRYRRHQCVADARDLVLPPGTPQRNAVSLLTGQHRRYHYGGGTNPRNVPDVDHSLGRIVPDVDDLVGRGVCHFPHVDDLIGRRATPPRSDPKIHTPIFRCGGVEHSLIGKAASYVRGSLVRLTFHQDRRILTVLAGTIIHSDGVIATSASCLSFLKSEEHKFMVDVKILATQKTYAGVLLDVDFCSNIAFVTIASSQPLPHAIFGKLDDLLSGDRVVTASCSKELGRSDRMRLTDGVRDEIHFRDVSLESPKPNYVEGYVSLVANEEENPEPHNARTSGLIIKACVTNRHDAAIGGCLVDPRRGVVGVVHFADAYNSRVEATPIELVLKYLEYFEKRLRGLPLIHCLTHCPCLDFLFRGFK